MSTNDYEASTDGKSNLSSAIEIKNEGNKLFVQGKYKEALDYYAKAIEVCPRDEKYKLSNIYYNCAASYDKLKNYKKVIEECSKALELDPNYLKALAKRANAAVEIEEFQIAIEDFCSMCIIENYKNKENITNSFKYLKEYSQKICREKMMNFKSTPVTKWMVDEYYIGYTKDPVYNNQQFLNELESSSDQTKEMLNAVKEFNNENYDQCIEHCTIEIKNKGKYMNEARNLRGSLYHIRSQYADAVMDFNEIANNPKASNRTKANALSKIPNSLHDLHEYSLTIGTSLFNRAIELDPKNDDIYVARAVLLPQLNIKNTNSDLDTAIRLNPDNKAAHINKAIFNYLNFFKEIVKTNFIHIDENDVFHLPDKLKRQLEKEAEKLNPLLKKYNDIAEPFKQYANVLHVQRNYEEADKYFKMAIEREPKNGKLYANLAWNHMLWKEEDYDTPCAILTEALRIDPSCEEVYGRFSQLEMKKGNYDHAVELFDKDIDLRSNDTNESTTYLCSMMIVAKVQPKMLNKYGKEAEHLNKI